MSTLSAGVGTMLIAASVMISGSVAQHPSRSSGWPPGGAQPAVALHHRFISSSV
jgi:hypothetical protein